MKTKTFLPMLIALFAALLGACTAPRQIAAYPQVTPIARYPVPPGDAPHAYLEIQVSDVDRAAQRVVEMTAEYGGYLSSAQSWYMNDQKITALELVVPATNFDRLCRALLDLGAPLNQVFSPQPGAERYGQPYIPSATISLQLHPAAVAWSPRIETDGWNPLRTFQSAFGVFMSIFGFLVDILIWALVVGGPFVLIGLGVYFLVRRLRQRSGGSL